MISDSNLFYYKDFFIKYMYLKKQNLMKRIFFPDFSNQVIS